MKKIAITVMLVVFAFHAFYPVVYAMEQISEETDEQVQEQGEVEETPKEEEKLEQEETEKVELEEPKKEETVLEENEDEENLEPTENKILEQEEVETEKTEEQETEIFQEVPPEEIILEPEIEENSEEPMVEAPNYAGRMYIETPTNGQTHSIATMGNRLKIQGWAVSNDARALLRVYVNNQCMGDVKTRTARGDVDILISPAYGGTVNTPNAGFEMDLDMSQYIGGTCQIMIFQLANNETVLSCDTRTIQIQPMQYEGRMFIDAPVLNQLYRLPDTEQIKLQGWAVSNDAKASIRVYVDNQCVGDVRTRTPRGDVDSAISPAYGGTANTPNAGFEMNLDISYLAEGTHQIMIFQIARNETIISRDVRNFEVKPKEYSGRMYIDTPTTLSYQVPQTTTMNIAGWAVSDDEKARMVVKIDGKDCTYQVRRTSRGDIDSVISPAYGGTTKTPNAGFSIDVNLENLAEGNHIMLVQEISRDGKLVGQGQINLKIETPNYRVMMNLEDPIHNKRYHSGILEVKGWALCEAPGDYLGIFVDGVHKIVPPRQVRPDVMQVFGNQFNGTFANPTPGFYAQIDTSYLPEGQHSLEVVHFSKYGKILETKAINFIISNTQTWGIDVSHHNATINWDAVKNSGVNFAILKIAEYRESSGRTIIDSKFEENYAACRARGIAVGGYIYSYAFNPTEALHEAEACLRVISGKHFDMPIFFDIEDHIVTDAVNAGRTNKENLPNAAITFCDRMNASGYQAGVYSYRNFFYSYLDMPRLERYNIWLAHYVPSTDYTGKYDIWQYTSTGKIPGISGNGGNVDLNWCFKRYY